MVRPVSASRTRQTDSSSTASRARVEQAEALEDDPRRAERQARRVLSFIVDEDVVVERMLARGRADDTEDVIRNRLRVYREETAPLLDYYADASVTVDAIGEVDEVNARRSRARQVTRRKSNGFRA